MLEIAKLEEFYPQDDQSNSQLKAVSSSLKDRIVQYEKQGFIVLKQCKWNGQMAIILNNNPKSSTQNESCNDEKFIIKPYQKSLTYYQITEREVGVISKFMFKFSKQNLWQKLLTHNFFLQKCKEINTRFFQTNRFMIMTIDQTENSKNYNIWVQFYSWTTQTLFDSLSTFFDKNLQAIQDEIFNFSKELKIFQEFVKTIQNLNDSESLSQEVSIIRHFKINNQKSKIIQTIKMVQEFEKEKYILYQPDNNDLWQLTYENKRKDLQFYEFILDVENISFQNSIPQDLFLNYYYDEDEDYIYIPASNSQTLIQTLQSLNGFQFQNLVHMIVSLLQVFLFQLALILEKKDYIFTLSHTVVDDQNQLQIDLQKMYDYNALQTKTRNYFIQEGLQLFKSTLYCIFDILRFLKEQDKQKFTKNQDNFLKSQTKLLYIFEKLQTLEISFARIQSNIQDVVLLFQCIESNTK